MAKRGRVTAGDLGTILLYGLVTSYTDARRALHGRIDDWDAEFFEACREDQGTFDRQTLIDLRVQVSQLARRVRAQKVRSDREKESWFAHLSSPARAVKTDERLTRSVKDLERIGERLRSAFDLVQVQTAHQQQRASEKLQRGFEVVTAVLLVPALIAGIFGANTELPGRGRWTGFALLVILMLLGTVLALGIIRLLRSKEA
jgi:Mg2+ and Co2+ transporter CorA